MQTRKKHYTWIGLIIITALFPILLSASYSGGEPTGIQGAFYKADYTCIYLTGSDEDTVARNNCWRTLSTPLNEDHIGYDGMSGNYSNIEMLRIKANTAAAGEELVIYIDNIQILDRRGNPVFTWNFNDNEAHGPYHSQGQELTGNGTIQTIGGEECFLIHAESETLYGYSGVETQWVLPECPDTRNGKWNLSEKEYTLVFDFYYSNYFFLFSDRI